MHELTQVTNLPPVSLVPLISVVHLDLWISSRFLKKRNGLNGILWGWGETDSWKKPEAKNLVTLSLYIYGWGGVAQLLMPPVLGLISRPGNLVGQTQREDMGLLEYQAMPSLRDVAHGGVFCTFSNTSAPDRGKWWCGPSGQAAWGPSITYKITPCCVTLLQPARRAAVLGQPSSLRWVAVQCWGER